jgi:hypothetical protein
MEICTLYPSSQGRRGARSASLWTYIEARKQEWYILLVVCFMGELAPNLVFPQFINNFDPNHLPEIKNVKFIDVIVESPNFSYRRRLA